ncbi:hypothetical protein DTO027I6_352 [Penicillium roqueforti]|uniref:uncharacterized protein n=1 Tax=Penicillium roqueforti TaxID=5082 RepID=UPI001909CDFF|nr:uncharacterized protein LCP9604111_3664 [Penicillium roqueforti]KAF9250148.1 hypothetical protein LCP9604111_3664 [Penicillium roqueforti]KAI2679599.1 hypothetical protein CBS147355_4081 [Penicillium roqueforti]KAI3135310.1 hypothetical protein CBS147330_3362 [Penicillium roqueforti]KAI3158671.1 hypothetical protein CBS147317_4759 [Penicillium roqueforti]KAI3167074.1 hypothetical protein DTO039G3_6341 [Penicillium roqueforti]
MPPDRICNDEMIVNTSYRLQISHPQQAQMTYRLLRYWLKCLFDCARLRSNCNCRRQIFSLNYKELSCLD